jgi:hypothetical protein
MLIDLPPWSVNITLCAKIVTRRAVVAARQPFTTVDGGETLHPRAKESAMADSDDIRRMSDPDFLAERSRVREAIEALTERLAELDEEFIKRAGAAWTEAVR